MLFFMIILFTVVSSQDPDEIPIQVFFIPQLRKQSLPGF